MKNVFFIAMVATVFGFISCTDNADEIIEKQKNEKQELFGINKGDVTNPGGGGEEDPDDTED
ncbi:hypothetical protein MHM83_11110 [Tenacibaculum sp. Mcav3-52]|uniref:hypothetical protein n=1 Tax=Tenacibaculum sp. Mcav3-52 TaxID=2917762 RepID=UPI001EF31A1F|nr:hypothetical protein [Tenacibaculum sp. Mcav3-52]MCG7502422.1 hypothetical protein [Tenacibaculum sp. Mcav3-52]